MPFEKLHIYSLAKRFILSYQLHGQNTIRREIISMSDIIAAIIMIPAILSNNSYHDFYDALQIKEEGRYRVWDKFFTAIIFLGCQIGCKLNIVSIEHQNYSHKKQVSPTNPIAGENLATAQQASVSNKGRLVEQSTKLNKSLSIGGANRLGLPKAVKDIQESEIFSRFSIGHRNAIESMISIEEFIKRVFQGNHLQLQTFLGMLDCELPINTSVYIRGSSITGYKWRTGQAFDRLGFSTSDLDIVFSGPEILKMWNPDNFKIPLHYTMSLGKETPQAALMLGPLKKQLEVICQREVNIQAASDIYLSLRLFLQNISYLKLLQK